MKPISPEARELLKAVEHELSFTDRLRGRRAEHVERLRRLGDLGEPATAPALIPLVFGADRVVARCAADALRAVFAAANPADLWQLDQLCRTAWSSGRNDWKLARLQPRALTPVGEFGDAEAAVIGVASFHPNGYVREAAVTRLRAMPGGLPLSLLVLRLNDWVEEVALSASAGVGERVAAGDASSFLFAMPLLLRLAAATRRHHAPLLGAVDRMLLADEHREVLARGLASPDDRVRRSLFRLARTLPDADNADLLRRALADADTALRLEAVRSARRAVASADLGPVLDAILNDPYPPVRREGLSAAAELPGNDARAALIEGAIDGNRVVREVARFYLLRRGIIEDFAAFYRDHLRDGSSPRRITAAVAGLGETGTADDARVVAPMLTHERPAVRRAAVRAMASLDVDAAIPRLVELLDDDAPGVVHAVRDSLRPHAARIGRDRIRGMLRSSANAHGRLDALALGIALGKWDGLAMLLEASGDADGRVRDAARAWLRAWIAKQNRTSAQPAPVQLQAVREAIDARHVHVDPALVAEVRSILRFWERAG